VPPVLVQIDYDNAVFVNHERTDPQRVIAAVTRYRAETPDAPVLMDVHDLARHGLIVGIWDGLADKRIPAQIHRTRTSEA
jgi:biopolymer transport protein ExbD